METSPSLIASITDLTARLLRRLAAEDADERAYLRSRCSPRAQQALGRMDVEALHLLDAIPTGCDPGSGTINIVGLASATGVPKGTVSKRVQRLADIGVVARRRRPGNRKEVHLQLTGIGKEIRAAHISLHRQMGAVPEEFLARYSPEELQVIARVLRDLVRMPRDGVRFRPDQLD